MDSLALLTSSPSFLLRYFFFNLQTFLCCHFLSTWNQGRDRHQPEAQEALELLRVLCPRFTASFRIMLLATNGVWSKWHLWEVLFGTNEISCKAEAGSSKGQVEWSFVAEQRKVTIVILSRLDPKLFPKIYIFLFLYICQINRKPLSYFLFFFVTELIAKSFISSPFFGLLPKWNSKAVASHQKLLWILTAYYSNVS